ncbi:urea active transporter [[Candida] anglica]|uniref:Urea active transporter n=1 Tax=[Candida] anglica TaxID=148631 RepID=A0ABP0EM15_9ASCO
MSAEEQTVQLLGKSAGYGVLVGVGALFALAIVVATKLMNKYLHEDPNSTEMFMVANRSVGTGLTTSAVYSSWSWATEFLWCVTMVYLYGVMSAFWYGAGLTVQICLMSVLGIEAKKKIPASHTSLEIVELRYGKACHILYMFLSLVNNLLSCASMILGAAGAISVIAGNLHIVASTMLIPFGVLLYTTVGGLKSTFLTDFVHSFILLIVLCYISTSILAHEEIGGIGGLYDLALKHDGQRFIEGNYKGSLLTGKSQGAIFFGLIHAIGDTGLTVMDSSFWQKSFSADLKSSVPAYILAAVFIFANVWPLGTIVGLANVILEDSPSFPTYPRKMTSYEINNGFGLPYVLKTLLGDGALGALLLIIYLAVTSTVSAQMISVSSIMSFDIYKKYIKPDAQNKHLIRASHFGVVFFGLFAAGFSVMLHYVGVDMTWMGYFYSMLICPGVFPLIFTITWSRQTTLAAFVSPIVGMLSGIAVWLGTAYAFYGEVTIFSTGQQLPCLYGSMTTLLLPAVLSIVLSLTINPSKFDWDKFKEAKLIVMVEEDDTSISEKESIVEPSTNETESKKAIGDNVSVDDIEASDVELQSSDEDTLARDNERTFSLYYKLAYGSTIFTLLLTWVVWPLPLYRDYIWSRPFFIGWTAVSVVWIYLAFLVVGVYPLWDGRHELAKVFRGVWNDYLVKK